MTFSEKHDVISPVSLKELTTSHEVMFFDTDCGGVVHNLAYLRMIETCRTKLAIQLGFDLREMAESQQFPVLLRTEVDYKLPAHLGDTVVVRGRIDEVGKVRFWCAFTVHREVDDALLGTCRQQLALVQMPSGRPLRLPKTFLD